MKLLRQLHEMAEFNRHDIGMGMTQLDNENFILAGGFRSGNSRGDQTRLKYMIYDPKIFAETKDYERAEIGYVELFVQDGTGEIQGLVNVELKPKFRKGGYGRKLIRDLVDTTKSGLSIYDIQKKAKKFWDKMGVQYTDRARRFGHIPKLNEATSLDDRLQKLAKVERIAQKTLGDAFLAKQSGYGITQGPRSHPDREVLALTTHAIDASKLKQFITALKKSKIPTGKIKIGFDPYKQGQFKIEIETDGEYFSIPVENEIEFWKQQGKSFGTNMMIDRLNSKRLSDVSKRRKSLRVVK